MQVKQLRLVDIESLTPERLSPLQAIAPQLVLVFGSTRLFEHPELSSRLHTVFPDAVRVGCSTAGEISDQGTDDDSLLIHALHLDHGGLHVVHTRLSGMEDSEAAGRRMGEALLPHNVHTALVFAPGTNINGSSLIDGITAILLSTRVAGGLAGDGPHFRQTYTLHDRSIAGDQVVVIGFSSTHLQAGFGSYGGWKPFGPVRQVTRAQNNVLYELDGKPALSVYKRYLGEHAAQLPSSGLLFPFSMLSKDREEVGIIRTILAIDEEKGSLILAGDVFDNGYLQLMHANADSLVDGAIIAAEAAALPGDSQGFVLLVSCVGRKLVMGGRTDEEVDAVIETLGKQHVYGGFHSYGEISPGNTQVGCNLYNQTMTVTFIREV